MTTKMDATVATKTSGVELSVQELIDHCNAISPDFIPMLKATGAKLSGSTVLYFALKALGVEPGFELSDLDFYVSKTCGLVEFNEWFDKSVESGLIKTTTGGASPQISCYSGDLWTPQPEPGLLEFIPPPHDDLIAGVRYGFIGERKIDIILLTKDTPQDYIWKYFDLDFCKIMFDGEWLQFYDMDAVKAKACTLTANNISFNRTVPVLAFPEYEKAIKEGDMSHPDPLRYIQRVVKYRNRGFKITVSPNFKINAGFVLDDTETITSKIAKACGESIGFNTCGMFVTKPLKITEMKYSTKSHSGFKHKKEWFTTDVNLLIDEYAGKPIYFNSNTRFINVTYTDFVKKPNSDHRYVTMLSVRTHKDEKSVTTVYFVAIEIKQVAPEPIPVTSSSSWFPWWSGASASASASAAGVAAPSAPADPIQVAFAAAELKQTATRKATIANIESKIAPLNLKIAFIESFLSGVQPMKTLLSSAKAARCSDLRLSQLNSEYLATLKVQVAALKASVDKVAGQKRPLFIKLGSEFHIKRGSWTVVVSPGGDEVGTKTTL